MWLVHLHWWGVAKRYFRGIKEYWRPYSILFIYLIKSYAFHETIYFLIVLFGLIILWILCKKKQIICWLCHLNDRYFFLLRKRKVYFIVLARISYLGNFIPIFPSIIMLLLIIHLIYNFLSVVLLLPDPVFRSYSTNNAKMIYIRI